LGHASLHAPARWQPNTPPAASTTRARSARPSSRLSAV
jgi:hypothetical protein